MEPHLFAIGQTYTTKTGHLLTITDVSGNVIHFSSDTLKTGCFDRSGTYFMSNSTFAQTLKLIS